MRVNEQLHETWSRDEMFWRQQFRIQWLKEGDSDTKFFHISIVIRRGRNRINLIKGADGSWVEGDTLIRCSFEYYFASLFN